MKYKQTFKGTLFFCLYKVLKEKNKSTYSLIKLSQRIVKDICQKVPRITRICVIGRRGSGKTCMIAHLMRTKFKNCEPMIVSPYDEHLNHELIRAVDNHHTIEKHVRNAHCEGQISTSLGNLYYYNGFDCADAILMNSSSSSHQSKLLVVDDDGAFESEEKEQLIAKYPHVNVLTSYIFGDVKGRMGTTKYRRVHKKLREYDCILLYVFTPIQEILDLAFCICPNVTRGHVENLLKTCSQQQLGYGYICITPNVKELSIVKVQKKKMQKVY